MSKSILRPYILGSLLILIYCAVSCLWRADAAAAREYISVHDSDRTSPAPPPRRAAKPARRPFPAPRQSAASGRIFQGENGPRLFGAVELPRPLDAPDKWLSVITREKGDSIFIPKKMFDRKTSWEQFQATAPKGGMEMLRYVNSFWNKSPYREDRLNWGQEDYWEIPAEFIKKSGDCEDYAIAKYYTLKALGYPADKMRIVVLMDTVRNLEHAVLVVYMDNNAYVLDNLNAAVLPHSRLLNYLPIFSVNEHRRWTHILPKNEK